MARSQHTFAKRQREIEKKPEQTEQVGQTGQEEKANNA
jgi:hypothetical protein